jgi:hypothetical protein
MSKAFVIVRKEYGDFDICQMTPVGSADDQASANIAKAELIAKLSGEDVKNGVSYAVIPVKKY